MPKTRKGPKKLKKCQCSTVEQTEGEEFKLCGPCLFAADIRRRAALKRFLQFSASRGYVLSNGKLIKGS